VVLKDGDKEVYLIGISHVSKRSVLQTERLIQSVKPDAVMLELCLARCGQLLREEENYGTARDERAFWIEGGDIKIQGLPEGPGFPTEDEVLEWIGAKGLEDGQPLTRPNFDQFIRNLLNLGIFSSVRINAESPTPTAVPLFVSRRQIWYKILPAQTYIPWELGEDDPKELYPVYPLGSVTFNCTERAGMLATIRSVKCTGDIPAGLGNLEEKILKWFGETKSTLRTLMLARKEILELQPDSQIQFLNGDSRDVTVQIRKKQLSKSKPNTGMEETVFDTRGVGIMPIQLQGYTIPKCPGAEGESHWMNNRNVKFRKWSEAEKRKAPESLTAYLTNPVASAVGEFLITRFGRFQDKAGRKCGIKPGEAWQIAFEAAVNSGAKMVVLGDQLTLKTQAALATELFNTLAVWLTSFLLSVGLGAYVQANPSFAAEASEVLKGVGDGSLAEQPYLIPYGLALLETLAAYKVLYAPVRDMEVFARQKGSNIEEKLKVKTPLSLATEPVLLEGEDSLLSWPKAKELVLQDRNEYMADTLFRMVRGLPSRCPAYATYQNSKSKDFLQRFLVGPDFEKDSNPEGVGIGPYETPELRRVVAVVGAAHLFGIQEEFRKLQEQNKK